MSAGSHRGAREALGAYCLGLLEPSERAALEQHLATCADCREEVARMAVLPPLLGRLSIDEAVGGVLPNAARLHEAVLAGVAAERRSQRRWIRAWQAVAAAAAVTVLAMFVAGFVQPAAERYTPQAVAEDAAGADGVLAVIPRDWGMTVELELRGLPIRDGYGLWAVTADDHRALAASWAVPDGAPIGAPVRVTGSCYVAPADVVLFEVATPQGEVVVVFET